jgi:superfamily II DNA or RNA helicase
MFLAKPKYVEIAPIEMFDETREGYFGVPRYYYKNYASMFETVDFSEISDGLPSELEFTSKLRPQQEPMVAEFEKYLSKGKTGFMLKARTGFGKTVILLKFLSMIGGSALVIVPQTNHLENWRKLIALHTNLKPEQIGHVQADKADYIGKPLSLGMIHSVCKDKYGGAFKNYFSTIIFDELHKTGAHYFSRVVSMFTARYRIGATATLSRPDGMDVVFRYHMGEVLLSLTTSREEEVRPRVLVVNFVGTQERLPGWIKKLDKIPRRGKIISALAEDNRRNDMLLPYISQIALSGRRVLVLSERIGQLEYLIRRTDKVLQPGLYIHATPDSDKRVIEQSAGRFKGRAREYQHRDILAEVVTLQNGRK